MTTLAVMKARIASELRRTNISTQIADAINTAITALESSRFSFNESRAVSFNTVAEQEFYGQSDSAYIPRLVKIDYVKLIMADYPRWLTPERPEIIETMNSNGTQFGEPVVYCYYGEQIRFGYIPNAVFAVRIGALIRMPAPATDAEASNPWMTKAERAVRCRAKYELYEHVLMNPEMALRYHPDNEGGPTHDAVSQLRQVANDLQSLGEMEATEW